MTDPGAGLSLLSAMITPAVLISACGTLIFSTSTRLARVVDRARGLGEQAERIASEPPSPGDERVHRTDIQLGFYARRSRLVQGALTSFYISLGLFVASTVAIGVTAFIPAVSWAPSALGVIGTLVLFAGCVLLISETRLAVVSLEIEMDETMRLAARTREARLPVPAAPALPVGRDDSGDSPWRDAERRATAIERDAAHTMRSRPVIAAATALLGLATWIAIAWAVDEREAWNSPLFYEFGVPLLAVVSALAGFIEPRGAGWWGVATMALVPMAVVVANAGQRTPLTGVGLMLLGALAVSLTIFSLLGAGVRLSIPPRR